MKRKNKGFTLIELLAVIVILGLLMAIAIPSVTKYITESRKKTLTTTIGNYIGALVNDVNDLTYTFTEVNTVYAVPIECIALERGGTNPFGHWLHANDGYWAYVLVQYDDSSSSYNYGYTFKDSAGYGMYPTSQSKLNERGTQIKTGLTLSRPTTGKVTNMATVEKWNGFDISGNTNLKILMAVEEGNYSDGITTCTMKQKASNYNEALGGNASELPKVSTLAGTTWRMNATVKNYDFFDAFNTNSQTGYGYFPTGTTMTDGSYTFETYYYRNGEAFGPHHDMDDPYVFWFIPENSFGLSAGWYKVTSASETKFWTGSFSSVEELLVGFQPMGQPLITFPNQSNKALESSQLIDFMYENAVMQ